MATFTFETISPAEFTNSRMQTAVTAVHREDVRGVAGVALATPFFQDLFYMPSRLLAILTPGYPDC